MATDQQQRVHVGSRSELRDGTHRIVSLDDGTEVGVIAHGGGLYAYRNRCSHQGGPVCEGIVIGSVAPRLGPDGDMLGERFDDDDPHLVCPWHGVEFHLLTGECVTIPRARLRAYEVAVEDDQVYLIV